ncbi:MAG: type I DNA topoisomerase [Desulfovibrio sp.]|nr:MAG: type I DNA topoisomerase [Desulfovibrio sp.]
MAKDLIIVESPAKVRTIKKFLGAKYDVQASVGHVRDLPRSSLGVDETQDFAPEYQVIEGKEEVVRKLKKAAAKVGHVYLAPDPDREGEAIAWHVAELIKDVNTNVSRIQFNEITSRAVKEALEHPKELNKDLFDSQQARRVLDRLVGYKISPILWKHVKRGISAGRVQSVALKLIVEREKERRAFKPEEYWVFKAMLHGPNPPEFQADLWKYKGKLVAPGKSPIGSAKKAEALEKEIRKHQFVVESVTEKQRNKQPSPPYITSTLQQDANRRLGYSSKRTMTLAQRLYEGVELGDHGLKALITYMRTDSVRIAPEALDAAKTLILEAYGKDYYPAKTRVFKSKKSAQDAHEAIRPVDVELTPETVQPYLDRDLFRLYSLIWQRFMASQMAAAKIKDTTITSEAGQTLWRTKGERILFPGYLTVYGSETGAESKELPKLEQGQELELKDLSKEQKFTQPPARYSEATLVKEMEDKGIGRPSTYAAIISTIQDRDYVKLEEKRFMPTELGQLVSDQLSEHFTDLMDVGFTADMEGKLDAVALGDENWVDLMKGFTQGFYPALKEAGQKMTRATLATNIECDKCGQPMVIKFSKNGEFLGCSGYPECKNIKNFTRDENGEIVITARPSDEETGIDCDKCGKPMVIKTSHRGEFLGCSGYPDCTNIKNFGRDDNNKVVLKEDEPEEVLGECPKCKGDLLLRYSRAGGRFIGCANYPKCKHIESFSTGVDCPREGCDGELVEKSSRRGKVFYSCNRYPDCDFALWNMPVPEPCPECGFPLLEKKYTKARGHHLSCPEKSCSFIQPLDENEDENEDEDQGKD